MEFEPPSVLPAPRLTVPSSEVLIIVGSFPKIKGGTKDHNSRPPLPNSLKLALNACSKPLLDPA